MAGFPTTRWSAVVDAACDEAERRERAWRVLAAAYYRPVYAHVRIRWRKSAEDAEDSSQAFFARAIEKGFFDDYDRERTRFRSYVRLCLDRFVANEEKAKRRLKRGGGVAAVGLDFAGVEADLQRAGAMACETPEEVFDREWSRALLSASVDKLREECRAAGRAAQLALFERYDLCPPEERPTYAELGAALGLTATTVTNRLHSVRQRFRAIVLDTLRELTASEEEYRSEAQRLLGMEERG